VTDTGWTAGQTGPLNARSTAFSGAGCIVPDPSVDNTYLGSAMLQQGGWNFAEYAPKSLDALLTQSVTTSDQAQRFAVYSKIYQQLQTDVPYVGLYASDLTAGLTSKFTWRTYNSWYLGTPYALGIKLAN
jgi:ABC-type transport system substrate-binding protein